MKHLAFLLALCLLLAQGLSFAESTLPATLYYNPDGGSYYHTDANCRSVSTNYLPMQPFDGALPGEVPYAGLKPCPMCAVGERTAPPVYEPRSERAEDAQAAEWVAADMRTEEAARAFAEAFFASPYVAESLEGRTLTVTRTEDGWRAELAGTPRLTLLFDFGGHVALYQNADAPLPRLVNGAASVEGIDDTVYARDAMNWVDELTRAYLNRSYDAVCCYAAEGDVYAYQLDLFDCFVYFQARPTLRLLGLGDLSQNACRYEGYLSRGEAVARARDALIAAYGLTREQADTLIVSQTSFNPDGYRALPDDAPIVCWCISFATTPDGKNGAYQAELDAKTGEVLVTRDPTSSGQG